MLHKMFENTSRRIHVTQNFPSNMEFKGKFQPQIPQPYNIFEWKNKILF